MEVKKLDYKKTEKVFNANNKNTLAPIMHRLGGETAFEVSREVEKLKLQGKDIIEMHIGQPDFNTPEHIIDAAIESLYNGDTGYTPSHGIMECREAVAEFIPKYRKVDGDIGPENVVITPGGKPVIFFGIFSTIGKGEEVLYPNPGYPIYISAINAAEGRGIPYNSVEELKKRINNKTRMIILNSPHNPTGEIIEKDDLEEIAGLSQKHNSLVMSDEVYSRIIYRDGFESVLQFSGMLERTILVDCHSKAYAMTGWRFGFGVASPKYTDAISEWMVNTSACVPGFIQKAGIAAMKGDQSCVYSMVDKFRKRRDLIVSELNKIDGIFCPEPDGAFYVFPDVTELCGEGNPFEDASDLRKKLLYEAGVSVLAREHFGSKGPNEENEFIRFSYATSEENILEGVGRIRNYLNRQ
ncbi:MAG: pyridoxal phosphate-dependent aminotransferase [Nanoarchaeota archaeon]